ncbi:hypothetical protein A2U01_0102691, partial [Trifolium medium]|nr:hypothetical protein [Trifolium medium]
VFEFVSTVALKLHFSAFPALGAICARLRSTKQGAEGTLFFLVSAAYCAQLGRFQARLSTLFIQG